MLHRSRWAISVSRVSTEPPHWGLADRGEGPARAFADRAADAVEAGVAVPARPVAAVPADDAVGRAALAAAA
jgi:hypothetical protein